jgi:hypothetical protein
VWPRYASFDILILAIIWTMVHNKRDNPHSTAACEAGRYMTPEGKCFTCEENTYSNEGDNKCTKCPEGYWSRAGSMSKENCYPRKYLITRTFLGLNCWKGANSTTKCSDKLKRGTAYHDDYFERMGCEKKDILCTLVGRKLSGKSSGKCHQGIRDQEFEILDKIYRRKYFFIPSNGLFSI